MMHFSDGGGGTPSNGDGSDTAIPTKAADAAAQAQERARDAAAQMQDRLREQLDQRSGQAALQINEQASDLRAVGESLRERGKDGPAKAAEKIAGYAEHVSGYLWEKDSQALLADAEDFGRRQPVVVAAAGLAAGLFASRLLKASSSRRYRSTLTVARPTGVYTPPAEPLSPTVPHPEGTVR
jgi:hypothetical protein